MATGLQKQLVELQEVMTGLVSDEASPMEIREVAQEVLREVLSAELANAVAAFEAGSAKKDPITPKAERMKAALKSKGGYGSAEFKCVDDYDKCKQQRANDTFLCSIAFLICIGRRVIPLVK